MNFRKFLCQMFTSGGFLPCKDPLLFDSFLEPNTQAQLYFPNAVCNRLIFTCRISFWWCRQTDVRRENNYKFTLFTLIYHNRPIMVRKNEQLSYIRKHHVSSVMQLKNIYKCGVLECCHCGSTFLFFILCCLSKIRNQNSTNQTKNVLLN